MFYRVKDDKLYDYCDNSYSEDELYTDLITQQELNKNPDKIVITNGVIELNPAWGDIELQKTKENKIAENDYLRDEVLNQGVIYKNILFDSDTDQKANLLGVIFSIDDEETIIWYGKDNQPLECNKEDLINIGNLITQLHTFCWNKNAEIKALISQAQTIEQVSKIVIDYGSEE